VEIWSSLIIELNHTLIGGVNNGNVFSTYSIW
jgi:hypothetical protein